MMLNIFFCVLLFTFSCSFCIAQNNKPFRNPYTLTLYVDSTKYYSQQIDSTTYFGDNYILQTYTGEQLFIEVELRKKEILSMRVVDKLLHPEKTIVIESEQKASVSKSEAVVLKIYNPFKQTLSYKAEIFYVGDDNWIEVPVKKVKGKGNNYEYWKEKVVVSILCSEWLFE